jgi:UDP-N-acetyl-D-mannosaminuronic acid transferase (WecB/TagA/CpsF family)
MHTERVGFLGVQFDLLTMEQVLDRLSHQTADTPFSYLVTPNVDHLVRLDASPDKSSLAPLYEGASLSLCDSRILQHLARLHGLELSLVPGSDLTVQLFRRLIRPGDRLAVVGGDGGLLQELRRRYPEVDFV